MNCTAKKASNNKTNAAIDQYQVRLFNVTLHYTIKTALTPPAAGASPNNRRGGEEFKLNLTPPLLWLGEGAGGAFGGRFFVLPTKAWS